jgi:hypothetical protein
MNRTRIVAKRLARLEHVYADAVAEHQEADRQAEALERLVDETGDALTAVGKKLLSIARGEAAVDDVEKLIAHSDELRAVYLARVRARNAAYLRRQFALDAVRRIEGRLERTERRVA